MSQLYPDVSNNTIHVAVTNKLPARTDALRTLFSGPTEPSGSVPFQLWEDTSDGTLYQRNSAGNAWVPLRRQVISGEFRGALADMTIRLACSPVPLFVNGITLISDATTSGSDGSNKYAFDVKAGATSLFSAVPNTDTGPEMTAETAYALPCDQNQTVVANASLTLVIDKTGSPTAVNILGWTLDCWELLP